MGYRVACLTSVGVELPTSVVTSEELEERLGALYGRLRLHVGRLELMTGIRERRFWEGGLMPSDVAARAGIAAIRKAGISLDQVGCLVNCSVSRDCVEPATASFVHQLMGLPPSALVFDVSNACLGMVNGVLLLANMVEMGQIEYGLAVCGENAGPLIEHTISVLNSDLSIDRRGLKSHFASLTIGSCASGIVVGPRGHRIVGCGWCCDTSQSHLCRGDGAGGMTEGSQPLMETDSETLLKRGVMLARTMWSQLRKDCGWQPSQGPDLVVTHQVGKAHRARLYEELGLDIAKDFSTFEYLGNCGSASLPATLCLAEESGRLKAGDHVAMLGIGSGINCAGLVCQVDGACLAS
ncbi:MAG: 3-oxoacyl-ACP synthase III [Lentisphaerae bacterium]|jgi:3-oxoacyl-[acyl-carrier-protein] synthase III|nr:3-oxoacyl-ACP synthase III [Lentisphaerota bacterium]